MKEAGRYTIIRIAALLSAMFFYANAFSQFYNKEVAARIIVEDKGEFIKFTATAENLTPSDLNLSYEFSLFKSDQDNNTSRTSQGDLFFLKAHEKVILSSTTVNRGANGEVILLHMIYDLDDKPLGKARLQLKLDGGEVKNIEQKEEPLVLSQDQAKPQDGFVLDGLVIENAITKVGRDFYRYYYSEYYNRQIKSPKNIEIEEVPGRGRTTRISLLVDNQVIFQFFAQPRKDFLKRMASIALGRTLAYLQQLQQQKENFIHY